MRQKKFAAEPERMQMGKLHKRLRIMRRAMHKELREHRSSFLVFMTLRFLVVVVMVLQALNGNYENVFLCAFTLILMLMPSLVQLEFRVELPKTLEIIILLFIFSAEILGEIGEFYLKVPNWDTIMHTLNGFLAAAVGFSMIDLLNRSKKYSFNLSPLFLALVAFCFSMTIGVLWEFFEFAMDQFFGMDMQKDTVLSAITSVMLNPDGRNIPVTIDQIREVMINGQPLGVGGYLDIGLIDTMEDLFVNFIGAAVFSVIGFFYVRSRGKGVAGRFIPRRKRAERDFLKIAREQSLEESENKEKIQSQKRE